MTTTLTRSSEIAALTADSPVVAPGTLSGLLVRILTAYAPVAPVRR